MYRYSLKKDSMMKAKSFKALILYHMVYIKGIVVWPARKAIVCYTLEGSTSSQIVLSDLAGPVGETHSHTLVTLQKGQNT